MTSSPPAMLSQLRAPSPTAMQAPRQHARLLLSRAFTLVEMLISIVIIGLLSTFVVIEVRTLREKSRQTVVMNATRTLQAAQQTWRASKPSFSSSVNDPTFQSIGGYTPEPGVQLLAQLATSTKWAGIMARPDASNVCGAVIDRVNGKDRMTCTQVATVPLSISSATPTSGQNVTLDVSAATALLMASTPVSSSSTALHAQASIARQRTVVLVGWDFGDGSTTTGGAPTGFSRIQHTFQKGPAARRPIKVAILDSWGQVHLGRLAAGATMTNDENQIIGTPGTGNSGGIDSGSTAVNLPPVARVVATPQTVSPGQWVSLSGAGSSDAEGSLTSYAWSIDGVPVNPEAEGARTANYRHRFSNGETGSHTATLVVTDAGGLTSSASASLTVSNINQTPTAVMAITLDGRPTEVVSVRRGLSFSSAGSTDPDGGIASSRWDLGDGSPSVTGNTVTRQFPYPGLYTIRLVVTDNRGASGEQSRTVSVINNRPPVACGSVSPLIVLTAASVQLTDCGSTDADGDTALMTRRWSGASPTALLGGTQSVTFPLPGFYPLTYQVVDDLGDANENAQTTTVRVNNRAPVAGTISCTTLTPLSQTSNTCTVTGASDPDGGTLNFSWNMGEDWVGTTTGTSVTGAWTTPGARTMVMTVSDQQTSAPNGALTAQTTRAVTVQNRPPIAGIFVCTLGVFTQSPLTCTASGWTDPDGRVGSSMTYGTTYLPGISMPGATSQFVYPTPGIYPLILTVQDPDGGTTTAIETVIILNRLPVATTTTACSFTTLATGETTTCTTGWADPDNGLVEYYLGYLTSPAEVMTRGGTWSTSPSLSFTPTRPGQYAFRVGVRDNQGFNCASPAQGGTNGCWSEGILLTVTNRLPSAPGITCTPASTPTGSVATCSITTPAIDPDSGAITYEWSPTARTGPAMGLSTTYSLNVPYLDWCGAWCTPSLSSRTPLAVTAYASDGQGGGRNSAVANISFTNRNPTAATVTCLPNPAVAGSVITCSVTTPSTDPDGGNVTYQWATASYRTSSELTSPATYLANFPVSQNIAVATIDYQTGYTVSNIVTLQWLNRNPPAPVISCTPTSTPTGSVSTCSIATPSVDPDGQPVTYTWSSTGRTGGATGASTSYSLSTPGSVTATATASDNAGGTSPASNGVGITFTNRSPVYNSTNCSPLNLPTGSTTTCTMGWTDPDGGTLEYLSGFWDGGGSANFVAPAWRTGDTLSFTPTTPGTYSFYSAVRDNQGFNCAPSWAGGVGSCWGIPAVIFTVTNRAPAVPSISCTPTSVPTGQNIVCTASGGADPDGGSVTYDWSIDGTISTTLSGPGNSIATLRAVVPRGITAFVRARDNQSSAPNGEGFSAYVQQAGLTFTNRAPIYSATTCSPLTLSTGGTVTCTMGWADPDGGTLEYFSGFWNSAGSVQFIAPAWRSGNTLSFTPSIPGQYAFYSAVRDNQGFDCYGGTFNCWGIPAVIFTVNNQAPATPSISCTPTSVPTGQNIVCTASGGADPDGGSVSYDWSIDATTTLSGPGNSVATITSGVPRGGITAFVRARDNQSSAPNGEGFSAYVQQAGLTFTNRAPIYSATTCSPMTLSTGSTVTCTMGWADPDGGTLEYFSGFWNSAGSVQFIAPAWRSGNTLSFTPSIPGQYAFYSAVRDNQGFDCYGGTFNCWGIPAVIFTVNNRAPAAPSISCTPTSVPSGQSIVCTASGGADPDGGSVTYEWSITGGLIPAISGNASNTATLTSGVPLGGVIAYVRARDNQSGAPGGEGLSPWAGQGGLTFLNRDPVHFGTSCSPASPATGTQVTCTMNWADPDGGTLSYLRGVMLVTTPQWIQVVAIADQAGNAFTFTPTVPGTYIFHSTVSDGQGFVHNSDGSDHWTNNAVWFTVSNQRPATPSISISQSTIETNQDFSVTVTTAGDPEGHSVQMHVNVFDSGWNHIDSRASAFVGAGGYQSFTFWYSINTAGLYYFVPYVRDNYDFEYVEGSGRALTVVAPPSCPLNEWWCDPY